VIDRFHVPLLSVKEFMDNDVYKTIKSPSEGYFIDKRSKFHAFAFPIETEEEVKMHLLALKKRFHDARHHVFAWILGIDKLNYRMNDDGEPSGSAAKPVYGQLCSYDLTDILIVVVRYFGGVKLGVPGLINAYRMAAKEAIENATIIEKVVEDKFKLRFDYLLMNDVMKILKDEDLLVVSQEWDNECSIVFRSRKSNSSNICNRFETIVGLSVTKL
jgi:uncharacterized YigZ family protein